MLSIDAVEIESDRVPAHYSKLFLLKYTSGGWRFVTDLSPLNVFVVLTPFKMESCF